MNLSKSVALLKQIESDTTTANTSLSNIETDANTLASAISSSEMSVNIMGLTAFTTGISNAGAGTLNVAIASDDAVSTNIASVAENRRLNFSSQYQNLQWSGSSNSLSAGDYSSTTGKAWWQNTSGDSVIITKITVGFMTSETTWVKNRMFTSTASAGSSWIRWGTADDTTAIDTEIIKFNQNGEMTACMTRKFDHPDASGDVYYGWVIDNLNIIVSNNEYFMCEFSGTINASGDDDLWSGIYVDVKQS